MLKENIIKTDSFNDIKISTIYSGIKNKSSKEDDLVLIEFGTDANIAGVFTKSLTSSAPVNQCKHNIQSSKTPSVRAIIVNSGNANAFTGKAGEETVLKVSKYLSKKFNCNINQIYTASTGVIGEQLNSEIIINGINKMEQSDTPDWLKAANAIRTTDTFSKLILKKCQIDNTEIDIVGIAKGSGMIAPDMATMLGFIFTNANLPSNILQKLLKSANEKSFNSITVDSDTSTSDTVLLSATKKAKHKLVHNYYDKRLESFKKNLDSVMLELAKLIVKDGEGASKFITIKVIGAISKKSAKKIAFSIANSPLVKTAIAGEDANWGRIVMAIGKSGEYADRDKIKIFIGGEQVTNNGMVYEKYSEIDATNHLKQDKIKITVDIGVGKGLATVYTCDLTHKYIEINADYRS
ncbi:bifunctional glutamate N-acetyltransferase/amino-acid acetyltransferase ArgJ [Alphaproteobacteria bacterium]|nr:bifunctional glutamate N-acetyltransferase/amino-acid acetyltransferase ArgJ [Alphaproteobacteria bacterium]